eukprot:scaffold205200_cov39-Prasinocladus_malaysianus.AAC.1
MQPLQSGFWVILTITTLIEGAAALCEYWGTGVGCNYDGDFKKPENCKGLGRRYCDRAPEVKECPPACQPQYCKNNWKSTYQFHKNHFEFAWEDLVLAGASYRFYRYVSDFPTTIDVRMGT